MTLSPYAKKFIDISLTKGVLQFGDFTLKSGRRSPYFFNAGLFNDGQSLLAIGECYAAAIIAANIEYDVLFGPAYKGIPLVCATAFALMMNYGINKPFAFNRKEIKDHGEGGAIVGSPLTGRVLILDDVITAGTAMRESVQIIQRYGAQIAGVMIGLDRQEKGLTELSALQELRDEIKAPVFNVTSLNDLILYADQANTLKHHFSALQNYQKLYGI